VKLTNSGFELDDIWFTDIKTGFVAGATSLFTSVHSGNTWSVIPNTRSFQVFNTQFLDKLTVFAQGTNQLAFSMVNVNCSKTKDGGNSSATTFGGFVLRLKP
jgi:hypothetical protein